MCDSQSEDLPTLVIRNFANRRACHGVEELKSRLETEFAGMSVSIQYLQPSGMHGLLFVDVTPSGVFESYGDQAAVDFDALGRKANITLSD